MYNIAFIDGQNLHLGTATEGWKVDLYRFRVYLEEKYNVGEAYYFMGYIDEDMQDLYSQLQKAGFIIQFKEHNERAIGKKKGNVDSDIILEMIKNLIDNKKLDKIVLVSGDGDYKKSVDYLISKNKFEKILFPNKKFRSSLYKKIRAIYYADLGEEDTRSKIILEMKKRT